MIVKRIGPLSLAKVSGMLYAMIGLLIGGCLALVSVVGGAVAQRPGGPFLGMALGVGAVFVLPILYGGVGFVASLLTAALYNAVAGMVGGVEMQFEQGPGTAPPGQVA